MYQSDRLVEQVLQATGRRANLVAIACDTLLRLLPRGGRTIDADLVGRALSDPAMLESLAGWTNLSSSVTAARTDRLCVYLAAREGHIRMRTLVSALAAAGLFVPPERLTESITRLELAYILRRDDEYRFCVPLSRSRGSAPRRGC